MRRTPDYGQWNAALKQLRVRPDDYPISREMHEWMNEMNIRLTEHSRLQATNLDLEEAYALRRYMFALSCFYFSGEIKDINLAVMDLVHATRGNGPITLYEALRLCDMSEVSVAINSISLRRENRTVSRKSKKRNRK